MNVSAPSIKPYLVRAVYAWCVDNDLTPYVSAVTDGCLNIPLELSRDGEIILNVSPAAVSDLLIDNEIIKFATRFNGVPRKIEIEIEAIKAIFAKELGQGLTFTPEIHSEQNHVVAHEDQVITDQTASSDDPAGSAKEKQDKSFLKVVK
ncbi:ClpXP protease specificity-enhancing factor [Nitrosomonas sp. ANs5]|uniref:ClpXP protease specificity-enhancing factor n=1 Tax=Nitrosomonas sp. ANs5 TaxID=3423941 RepID=UPI003D32714D